MQNTEYNPANLIGKKYRRGLLPYGGAVNSRGIIVEAISKEEFNKQMLKLRNL